LSKRKQQTIADWAAIGLCPALIVLLISSLVYFIVMCVYRGGYSGRVSYIWFMFIMGAVGIARLSIQESRKYALGYAIVLGGATVVVLSRFMTVQGPLADLSPILNAGIIALVWYLADRITFDCTLIDDDEDASGRGLLDGLTEDASAELDAAQQRTRKRGHQPGRTVMWLTAAALPIFGLGQAMLPADERWQRSALFALGVYLFAALSLLVATSFLGVRRYLRQRGVDMPANVSTAWLAGGVAMTLVLLLLCFLLPQPGKMLANAELPSSLESPEWLKPSKYGWGGETAKNDTESSGEQTASAADPSKQSAPDSSATGSDEQKQGPKQIDNNASQVGEQSGGQKSGDQQSGGEQQAGDKSENNKSGDQNSDGDEAGGDKSDGGKPSGDQSEAKQAGGDKANRGEKSGGEKSGEKQSGEPESGSPEGDNQAEPSSASDGKPNEQPNEQSAEDEPASGENENENADRAETPPTPDSSSLMESMPSLTSLFRFLVYAIVIGILAVFIWLQRHEIAKAWQAFLAWLRGEASVALNDEQEIAPEMKQAPVRPFSSFRNPLTKNGDPREAIIVTYQAAEAWWRERGKPRSADETPQEFLRRLPIRDQAQQDAMLRLTDAYNRVVYGNQSVRSSDLAAASDVWKSFANG
jgi:hypothetical protein